MKQTKKTKQNPTTKQSFKDFRIPTDPYNQQNWILYWSWN